MSNHYYDPYNNDVDLMNLLMEKHGHSGGMVRFRDIKTACGFKEVISCEGGAQITRWVKRGKACSIQERENQPKLKRHEWAGPGIHNSMYNASYLCNTKKIKMNGWSYITTDKKKRRIIVTKSSIIYMNAGGEYWQLYDYGEDPIDDGE
jgi:hypothetical protein